MNMKYETRNVNILQVTTHRFTSKQHPNYTMKSWTAYTTVKDRTDINHYPTSYSTFHLPLHIPATNLYPQMSLIRIDESTKQPLKPDKTFRQRLGET